MPTSGGAFPKKVVGCLGFSVHREIEGVTGVARVRDDFGYWERELLKLGHAAIHDKVLVIPFTKHSAVVTGSHNLGFKASYSNDENMAIGC